MGRGLSDLPTKAALAATGEPKREDIVQVQLPVQFDPLPAEKMHQAGLTEMAP